jgi:AraC family transcriptional regulator of adaptative response/methylated-DNA-[protein]-cysteine methyltransferase
VIALIERPDAAFPLPLDIRGTAFQLQVWQALRRLIPGTTASYAGIARQIGRPRATRAVARACAANPLAVVIPCHRVVRTDGGLGGYRWGIDRKRLLLNREAGP